VWFDSGDGRVALVAGNCTLDFDPTVPVVPTPNPNVRPVFSYPLEGTTQDIHSAHVGYQFAIGNVRYGSTAGRHPGHDFFRHPLSSSVGMAVHAVADGQVLFISRNTTVISVMKHRSIASFQSLNPEGMSPADIRTAGRGYVLIQHDNALVIYAHLDAASMRTLQLGLIRRGEMIGRIAPDVNGAHLHLEVRTYGASPLVLRNDVPFYFVDPYQYFGAADQVLINQTLQNRSLIGSGDYVLDPNLRRTRCMHTASQPVRLYLGNPDAVAEAVFDPVPTPPIISRTNEVPLSGSWQQSCGF
jgi:murein DD-endopeptidase MepM/ murein hydrolase activator NlpD